MPPVTEMSFAGILGVPSADKGNDWTEDIDEMLNAGEYREGVVFAGIDLRKVQGIEDVSRDAEEAMSVDASAVSETSNPKVATVSKKGAIKTVGKGTCHIYAYAQNGVFKKLTVK